MPATQAAAGGNKPQKVIKAATPIETALADVPQRKLARPSRPRRNQQSSKA
jgi:hypothetical protein